MKNTAIHLITATLRCLRNPEDDATSSTTPPPFSIPLRETSVPPRLVLASTFLLALALLVSGCHKPEAAEVEAPAPVQVTAVTQDTIRRTVAGDGVLWPKDQSSVMAKISAPVQKFYVNRGDHVKAGQLLATL